MTDADLWGTWQIWMAVAVVLVLVAASLLIAILLTARRILAEAVRALNAAESIKKNTEVIWALQATNDVAARMVEIVGDIATKGGRLAQALQGTAVGGRHAQ